MSSTEEATAPLTDLNSDAHLKLMTSEICDERKEEGLGEVYKSNAVISDFVGV